MNSILRLAVVSLALTSSNSADADFEDHNQVAKNIDGVFADLFIEDAQRLLDAVFTKKPTIGPTRKPVLKPTRAPLPTKKPTKKPVKPTKKPVKPTKAPVKPTKAPVKPTRAPVKPTKAPMKPTKKPTNKPVRPSPPTRKPTSRPTIKPPPQCGTLLTKDGNDLTLGPYFTRRSKIRPSTFGCNTRDGNNFAQSYPAPTYQYSFQVTYRCEYQFRTPEGNLEWETVLDVNSWFEQAAKTLQRVDNVGYKASDDDIIFSGVDVPDYDTDVIFENVAECPENYCVKVVGPSIIRKSSLSIDNSNRNLIVVDENPPSFLLYAFSNSDAHRDFQYMMRDAIKSSNNWRIFKTNHFQRCGCQGFCRDENDPEDEVDIQATCYVEQLCGERVFQIEYTDDYPEEEKAAWASTGTTQVMEWFNECASAMYGCTEHENSDRSTFMGTSYESGYNAYPKVLQYSNSNGNVNVYGLGGDKYDGFPNSNDVTEPQVAWRCPTIANFDELAEFGEYVLEAEYMRNAGLGTSVPATPCEPEIFNPPDPPQFPPQIGPSCKDIENIGYCYEMPGATCYATKPTETCAEVDLVMTDATSTTVYGDVADWSDACISNGVSCRKDETISNGILTYNGAPSAIALHMDTAEYEWGHEWYFILLNDLNSGQNTLKGRRINYDCDSWEDSFGAKNFTDSAAARYSVFGNTVGDLFKIQPEGVCTPSPTATPSEPPSLSSAPSSMPSLSPTLCGESYLTSENLNIALAVDLSFSTYQKQFSSTVDIGDINGDGKGNTILDAQIAAIQELLTAISKSAFLNNGNCEIDLISFETDAMDHGVWKPLSDSGDGFNPALMDYIKKELRAPTSNEEVFETNNGFTNFDAALDVTVEYFENTATRDRKNLLVFLSDGEPNVRGDGDKEGYCADTTVFVFGDGTELQCSDLKLEPGERHDFCRGNDPDCVEFDKYQDCVRGPTNCMNADAATQYESEIAALSALNVERTAIGIGLESNIAYGSALWIIDNNPAKYLGVLPLQALNMEDLSEYLSNLCILNTDPPTDTPSSSPTLYPTTSSAPSSSPSGAPSVSPTLAPSLGPSKVPDFVMLTPSPTAKPSNGPTGSPIPDPTSMPTTSPTTSKPSSSPTASPSSSPTATPTAVPTTTASETPTGSFYPSSAPTNSPTESSSPSSAPTGTPSEFPSGSPTTGPTVSPSASPTASPTAEPTLPPTASPTLEPTNSFAPTFVLPDCYTGPKMVVKDSSDMEICPYNQDMVQIREMDTNEVTLAINNVWSQNVLPQQLRFFVHTNGINTILNKRDGDGFQCLNTDGSDIDVEGDNEFSVECYQESADAPWLAVIEVVLTDDVLSNDIPDPCYYDGEPIPASCSWRMIIPCSESLFCPTDAPTISPTRAPTTSPSFSPTRNPTTSPSSSPTASPTTSLSSDPTSNPTAKPSPSVTESPTTKDPTADLDKFGEDDRDDIIKFPEIGPDECPDDILLVKHDGVTPYSSDSVSIVSQDSDKVTVKLTQTYTDSASTIDSLFYQYQRSAFSSKCLEEDDFSGEDFVEITIQCSEHSHFALFEFWVADDLAKGLLSEGDNVVVPKCCNPTLLEGTPVTRYVVEVKCVTGCPEELA